MWILFQICLGLKLLEFLGIFKNYLKYLNVYKYYMWMIQYNSFFERGIFFLRFCCFFDQCRIYKVYFQILVLLLMSYFFWLMYFLMMLYIVCLVFSYCCCVVWVCLFVVNILILGGSIWSGVRICIYDNFCYSLFYLYMREGVNF